MLRVLLFEDNAALRESLTDLLASTADMRLVGAYPTAEAAERRVRQHEPNLVLMDIDMPHRTGLEALAGLRAAYPKLDVVMLTVFDDNARVFEAIRQGATGYLLKSTPPDRLLDALRDAAAGGGAGAAASASSMPQSAWRRAWTISSLIAVAIVSLS